MKNFSDLLATELALEVAITVEPLPTGSDCEITFGSNKICPRGLKQPTRIRFQMPLLELVDISMSGEVKILDLTIEGYQIWPVHCNEQDHVVKCCLHKPFYQWLHEITGQGWLLVPAVSDRTASTDFTVAN